MNEDKEPQAPFDPLGNIPSWSQLLRVFPVAVWAVSLVGVGYWVGKIADAEYIEFLRLMCSK